MQIRVLFRTLIERILETGAAIEVQQSATVPLSQVRAMYKVSLQAKNANYANTHRA